MAAKRIITAKDLNKAWSDFKKKLNGFVLERARKESLAMPKNKREKVMRAVLDLYKEGKATNKKFDDIIRRVS